MTTSQSETEAGYADRVVDVVGGELAPAADTVKVEIPAERWVEALTAARDELGLIFFSWLSAVDWSNDPVMGEPVEAEVRERFEVLCTVADIDEGRRVTFSTSLDKESPSLPTLTSVYPGANWHERETAEMFGIDFVGHPHLKHLYLPDGFVGRPLLKSYPLLSREVKPWPGTVDVEAMPGADDDSGEADDGGDGS